MPELIDHVAALTGHRDRDLLDQTLARSLMDLLTPSSVAVYGITGDHDDQRWLERVRLHADGSMAISDPLWTDPNTLPVLSQAPMRNHCLQTRETVQFPAENGLVTTVFPVFSEARVEGIVEVLSVCALAAHAQRVIMGMQRIYCNMYSLLDYSERDALTGLLNRKCFDEAFYRTVPTRESAPVTPPNLVTVASSARAPDSWWLGMLDIDHFKQVNDNFGHLIGDEVLLLVARILRNTFRFHDRLYRFGGEEFVILLRSADEQGALQAFERFLSNMERFNFPQAGRITASLGFTGIQPDDSPSSAIDRADQAVYCAKKSGRNRAYCYADLVRNGLINADQKEGAIELF